MSEIFVLMIVAESTSETLLIILLGATSWQEVIVLATTSI
jgi:hypothetical protein